jgi:DNA (cytosine-5)-methyltransferase 1
MTTLPDRIATGEVEAPDLFCGGTPCQAFSVAGLRKSLDDARGNLSLVFCEIANAIDTQRAGRSQPPAIIFWENVPGVLSTKDNAFGCFIAGLAGETDPVEPPRGKWPNAGVVLGPQRTVAWRILDAQYFGLAQRRRRVFVVASARDDFDPASVLLEFDGMRRDSAPSRQAGEGAAASAGAGSDFGGMSPVAGTLTANTGGMTRPAGNANELDFCVPVKRWPADVASTLDTTFGTKQGLEDQHVNAGCPLFVPATPIAFHPTQDPISSEDGTTHCMGIGSSQGNATVAVAQATSAAFKYTMGAKAHGIGYADEQSPTLDTKADSNAVLTPAMQVRRLTPVECERLQGFPDGYTQIPWRKKPASECPDGPRYKALGNSWAVPVVRWIGSRIQKHTLHLAQPVRQTFEFLKKDDHEKS